jgi:type I restriction enzyme R subunit
MFFKFSVAYLGRYKEKADSNTNINIDVKDIETKALLES